ncbi:hypothetical protein K435DRAFT_960283 [Dendrothele bispora CBS 962.96]|uniref:Uncharacterized protein n=1 Tax=Dendrothele bispora (strain CBS 962.96) TaxID=1314807 RepID=A0A4V4HII1_DENBC|nr:hypothetical protein K435DRAFT_960283 [Dendrothele bispora CBS 962.96]
MSRCQPLNKLSKAPTSLLFRKQRPGDPQTAHIPFLSDRKLLDPDHPAAKLNRHQLPSFRHENLRVFAIPHGLLELPEFPRQPPFDFPFELWKDRIARTLRDPKLRFREARSPSEIQLASVRLPKYQRAGRIPMPMVMILTKKATSKFKFVRLKIMHRLKSALGLIVVRGATVKDGKVVVDDERAVEMVDKWILRGWTYTFFVPNLELYRLPLPELILLLQQAMSQTFQRGTRLEQEWAYKSLNGRYEGRPVRSKKPAPSPVFNQPHPLGATRFPKIQDKIYGKKDFLGDPENTELPSMEEGFQEADVPRESLRTLARSSQGNKTFSTKTPPREWSSDSPPTTKASTFRNRVPIFDFDDEGPESALDFEVTRRSSPSSSWRVKVKEEDDWEEDSGWSLDSDLDPELESERELPGENAQPAFKLNIPTVPNPVVPTSPTSRPTSSSSLSPITSTPSPPPLDSARESALKNVFHSKPVIENPRKIKKSSGRTGASASSSSRNARLKDRHDREVINRDFRERPADGNAFRGGNSKPTSKGKDMGTGMYDGRSRRDSKFKPKRVQAEFKLTGSEPAFPRTRPKMIDKEGADYGLRKTDYKPITR